MEDFKRFGWCISAEGLALCRKRCEEAKSRDPRLVPLDMDLRSVGSPHLSAVGNKGRHGVEGPLILQIQKVKNVALSSSKQNSSSGKRFLRIELTDGHTNISAVELEGPIEKLSLDTPPGTKVKIKDFVVVANGFMLLTKNSVEVLGGKVEGLLKKWSTTKLASNHLLTPGQHHLWIFNTNDECILNPQQHMAVPDNIGREKEHKEDGPPQFVKFGRPAIGGRLSNSAPKKTVMQPPQEETSTREKMELPSSYFSESAAKKDIGAVGDLDRNQPLLSKDKDTMSSQVISPSLEAGSHVEDIESIIKPSWKDRKPNFRQTPGQSSIRTGFTADSQQDTHYGDATQKFERGRGRTGKGRGRGRHRESEDYEDYKQPNRRDLQLFDFINQRSQSGQHSSVGQPANSSVKDEWNHEPHVKASLVEPPLQRQVFSMGEERRESNIGRSRGRGRGRGRPREKDNEKYRSSVSQPEPASMYSSVSRSSAVDRMGTNYSFGTDYGNERSTRTDYGNERNTRTSYGNERSTRTDYGNERNTRTSYGNERSTRTDYGNERNTRTSYGNERSTRTDYGNERITKTSYGNERSTRMSGTTEQFTAHKFGSQNNYGARGRSNDWSETGAVDGESQSGTQNERREQFNGRNQRERPSWNQDSGRAGQGRGTRTTGYQEHMDRRAGQGRGTRTIGYQGHMDTTRGLDVDKSTRDKGQNKVHGNKQGLDTQTRKLENNSSAGKGERKHSYNACEPTFDDSQVKIHMHKHEGHGDDHLCAPSIDDHKNNGRGNERKDFHHIVSQEWSLPSQEGSLPNGSGEDSQGVVSYEDKKIPSTSGGVKQEIQAVVTAFPKLSMHDPPPATNTDDQSPWDHLCQTAAVPASAKRGKLDL